MPSRIAVKPCGVTNFSPLFTGFRSTSTGMPFRSAICRASRRRDVILADRGREDRVLRLAEPQLRVERREPRGRADVAPGAAVTLPRQAACRKRALEQRL